MKLGRNILLMILVFSSLILLILAIKIHSEDIKDPTKVRISKEAIKLRKAPKIILQLENEARDIDKKDTILTKCRESSKSAGWDTIMSENFEGYFPSTGWQVYDQDGPTNGEYYWDDDDYKPHQGSWSTWCANGGANGLDPEFNNYPNYCKSWMIYGPFSLSDAGDAELLFYYWLESESDYDYFYWVASINDTDGYGYRISGNLGGWSYENFDLTNVPTLGNLTGKSSVWISFYFGSDFSNTYKGAFVDDVVLQKYLAPKPDLVIQSIIPSISAPTISEHYNVTMTVKNQGSADVNDWFSTSVFYNSPSAPSLPDLGDMCYWTDSLKAGATETFTIYKSRTSWTEYSTWHTWGVVDSWDSTWGRIRESNENNNASGVDVYWQNSPSPHYLTLDRIMENAIDFDTTSWTCSDLNAAPFEWICNEWECDYETAETYHGLPYSWGAWDNTSNFRDYIAAGLCAGSHRENDCIAGDGGDPIWATGIDCSGFVSRCWELGCKHGTVSLFDVADEIPYEVLRRGDALDDIDVTVTSGKHVVLFWKWIWANPDSFLVIEARSYGVGDTNNVVEVRRYPKSYFTYYKYTPIRFNYLIEPSNISGDCNSDGKVDLADVIYLANCVLCVGPPPQPRWKGDVNGSCQVNLGDVINLANYVMGKPGAPAPWCNGSCWSCV